jgi:hypothetical protein
MSAAVVMSPHVSAETSRIEKIGELQLSVSVQRQTIQ